MPRASRTSAEPVCEVTARLPCLATVAPVAAATRAAAVESVEGAAGVAAGAAGVYELEPFGFFQWKGGGGGTHGVDEAGDLGGGFAAGCEGCEEGRDLDVGVLASENLLHQGAVFFTGEGGAAFDDLLEVGLERHWLKRSR